MSWSWSSPSQDEALEAYQHYKSKYYSAANEKSASEKQERNYRSQKNSATSEMNALSSQKTNFEKRLKGIEDIIKMLEGNDGWFSTNVPDSISKAQKSLSKTSESYRGCIRLSGGVAAANMDTAFATSTVEGDTHSASALQAFKSEKTRLEQEIANLKSRIANLSSTISALSGKINACNSTQASLQASMNSYAYDMNHYKKYTY